jgi:hypothetical protein
VCGMNFEMEFLSKWEWIFNSLTGKGTDEHEKKKVTDEQGWKRLVQQIKLCIVLTHTMQAFRPFASN